MPRYRVTVAGKSYEVEVPDPSERPVRAIVDGQVFEVHVESGNVDVVVPAARSQVPAPNVATTPSPTPAPRPATPPVTSATAASDEEVFAPLPGTIVSISVAEGESVTHGQELCILEAMKMNNPIRASQTGVVKEILVSVGDQVQHGVPLMVIRGAESAAGE